MKTLKFAHSFEVIAELPLHLQSLQKLATNFRWTWHHETQQLFAEVEPTLWDQVEHNPVQLIRRLSPERTARLAKDPLFLSKLQVCEDDLDRYMAAETWFDRTYPGERGKTSIAYFCAEFGLNESLPIYSGGLGLLAGDHLKAASDIGLPLVGVGLLYSRGYFRQMLTDDGWQQENYPLMDFYSLPIQLMRGPDDQPLQVTVEFPDRAVAVQVWKAKVGRIELYLLDSNLLANAPEDQGITDTLYGGDEHMRIRQEMVLGIGGMKALRAMGIQPTVCHMNEGHAGFLTLERLRQFMLDHNCDFRTARQVTVAGNVFTTHTPVPAGFDVFTKPLLKQYMLANIEDVGLDFDEFVGMGRVDAKNENEPFNMAILAMENANYVNGVSHLHATVSRGMFQSRWPNLPVSEVPIEAITNGVHTMSWMSHRMLELLDRHLGPAWRDDPTAHEVWRAAAEIPDNELWEVREDQRADLVRTVRRRLMKSLARRNSGRAALAEASSVLDPRVLTIGFARRFATYKRASLLFSDKERLRKLIFHSERPIQFLFAGKSHPRDDGGKKLIQEIFHFIRTEGMRAHMVFLEDYDIEVARAMVQGVDVWLNNPRRPMEASGTSGMKVVPNGGLNCSILDGWWAEGYQPGLGWAIGDTSELADHTHQDWLDSQSLYQLLEQEISPAFYNRNEVGLPAQWIAMMRESMRHLAPRFSTARMVREYAQRFYMPSSQHYLSLQENGLDRARAALQWRKRVRDAWPSVKITHVDHGGSSVARVGEEITVRAYVGLGSLRPEDVRVQLLVGTVGANRDLVDYYPEDMRLAGEENGRHRYEFTIGCVQPGHRGFVCRVIPHHPDVHVASEIPLVVWQDGV